MTNVPGGHQQNEIFRAVNSRTSPGAVPAVTGGASYDESFESEISSKGFGSTGPAWAAEFAPLPVATGADLPEPPVQPAWLATSSPINSISLRVISAPQLFCAKTK